MRSPRLHCPLVISVLGAFAGACLGTDAAATRPSTSTSPVAAAAPSPQWPARTDELEAVVRRYDRVLAATPNDASALQGRGEALCLLGRVAESVRDFDRVVVLEPQFAPQNWQRGIALYYAGRFKDGAEQFERHQTVNPQDVENAAWHYLCLSRALGPDKGPATAREKLIPITRDSRVPLMKVHEMYAGRATPAEVLAAAAAGKPDADDLRERLFYGHLYIALYHKAHGRLADAARHAELAATTYGVDGYMGDVARLHAQVARRAVAATRPATPVGN
jgi:lipoprotein NlpI